MGVGSSQKSAIKPDYKTGRVNSIEFVAKPMTTEEFRSEIDKIRNMSPQERNKHRVRGWAV